MLLTNFSSVALSASTPAILLQTDSQMMYLTYHWVNALRTLAYNIASAITNDCHHSELAYSIFIAYTSPMHPFSCFFRASIYFVSSSFWVMIEIVVFRLSCKEHLNLSVSNSFLVIESFNDASCSLAVTNSSRHSRYVSNNWSSSDSARSFFSCRDWF